MGMVRRSALAALALATAASPAVARDGPRRSPVGSLTVHVPPARAPAAPLSVALAPGLASATPFTVVAGSPDRLVRVPHYIGPDGTYDEYADLVKSINGTPCGQDCARRALLRWGYAPADR